MLKNSDLITIGLIVLCVLFGISALVINSDLRDATQKIAKLDIKVLLGEMVKKDRDETRLELDVKSAQFKGLQEIEKVSNKVIKDLKGKLKAKLSKEVIAKRDLNAKVFHESNMAVNKSNLADDLIAYEQAKDKEAFRFAKVEILVFQIKAGTLTIEEAWVIRNRGGQVGNEAAEVPKVEKTDE